MANSIKKNSKSYLKPLLCILTVLIGGFLLWESPIFANWKDKIFQYVDNQDIITLEVRYSPEEILNANRQEILGNNKKVLQSTTLNYYPYLLLDIKYPEKSKTREGVLLWGLTDGEMVIDSNTWERTHGFRDCLDCKPGRNEFKILNTLSLHPEGLANEELQKKLQIDPEVLNTWINGLKQKGLIVQKEKKYFLHFENPKLLVTPQTRLKHHLVSKPFSEGQKISRNYSHSQIIAMTQAAFGSDFKIRSEQEIFLPVYKMEVLNPDGSIQFTEWNALTGQRLIPSYLFKN